MVQLWSPANIATCRTPKALRLLFTLIALAVCIGAAPARAATFSASLDRDTITLGESATLSLTFEGGEPQTPPSPPAIPNLQITYVGPSRQVSIVQNQMSSTVTHLFTVVPTQAGDYTLPAITASVAGANLTSNPLQLKVLKPSAPPQEAIQSGAQVAFLKLLLPKTNLYAGEMITAQLQLWLRSGVQGLEQFGLTPLPAGDFNFGKIVQGRQSQSQVGNITYTVVPLGFTAKPVKTGKLTIGPVTATVVVELASRGRRRDPFFEQFGIRDPLTDFFGGGERKQLTLATEPQDVQVLPLPTENVPSDFAGAVGNYSMTATAGPTNVAAGDPITLKVQISGRGELDALNLPEQRAWRDFKTYPATSKVATTDPMGLQGTKSFEQVVVPQTADIKQLPAFSFSFFDPDQKKYRTLTQPPVPLVVRPGGSVAAPTIAAASRGAQDPPPQEIVHIKPRLGPVAQAGPPLLQRPWFLAFQGVPLLAWVLSVAWRKRTDALARNPRLRRRREVAQLTRDGLVELRKLAAENKSEAFFATLFRLLQEQLGERLDLPASAITEAVIDEHLRPRGVPETVLAPLQDLFQTCNLARYAPVKTSQELAAIIPRLESLIPELQAIEA